MEDNNYNNRNRYNPNNRNQGTSQNRPDTRRASESEGGFFDLDGDGFIGNTGGFYGGTSYLGANYDDWNNNLEQNKMRRDDYGNEYDRQRRSGWNKGSQEQGNYQQRPYGKTSHEDRFHGQQQAQSSQPYQPYQPQNRQSDQSSYRQEGPFQGANGNYSRPNTWSDQRINRAGHDSYRASEPRNDRGRYQDNDGSSWWERTKNEVSSWFDDTDNERKSRDQRAMGPYRGKGPKGYVRSTERMRDDINDRLSDDPYVDATDVEVEINGNEVILKGNVISKAEKRHIEDLVESISGVSHIENRLRVEDRHSSSNRSGTSQRGDGMTDSERDNNRKL